ncbi:conserved membrane hypothetical protein [Bosea sp. 62]|uniref:hypothetical protein n=1 Tax=unclassified Bosea (in: a-proteobacteria) TaxID=2653178 RepID=UPI0012580C1C|nr:MULTISPECIES: hypothetical protein [unclassified Bosea (in: a-proteobacteria)]CAD5288646.1 conserved membrane hypothetical protein [Bosea sp. 7B]CAD5300373.1 conserved membrane hypothetical protein [Bosea sp. 21B]CAD5300989.1 conserved membrane hypothetical protein [Bosea sp. 46]VVT62077.1 conserved membrane hypothetical protein [Bosea sp. EC-HK365B]VXB62386.1 conserved membrane hypothetical protein [Bosea sp. 125]
MKDRGLYAWITVFAVVVGILIWNLSPSSSEHPSIGGGGYDLSGPVYTLALLGFTGLWTLAALLTGLNHGKARIRRCALVLAAMGFVTFSASFMIWGNNLS